jgi:hypothetical protein
MQGEAGGQQLIGSIHISFGGSYLEKATHNALVILDGHRYHLPIFSDSLKLRYSPTRIDAG